MNYGFVRVAAVSPKMRVADVEYNTEEIIKKIKECSQKGVQVAVFPELAFCGYTCSDLFLQPLLLNACLNALKRTLKETENTSVLCFVGMPLEVEGKLYNVSAVFQSGKLLAFVPKTHLPNYAEFYEMRHFTSAKALSEDALVLWDGKYYPVNSKMLFTAENMPTLKIGCELCEDLWAPDPPSVTLARMGATIVVNLSASNEVIGKKEYRTMIVKAQSGRCDCGYVYSSCGIGESTTDTVFSGHCLIAENGALLTENKLFQEESLVITEIDVEKLSTERRKNTTFTSLPCENECFFTVEPFEGELTRSFSRFPFVPSDKTELKERSNLILSMQANALAKRLKHTNSKTAVLGISGGLDSTLALLVTAMAFDIIGKDRKEITAITMPGFGTTDRTYNNACDLVRAIGATLKEINISKSVLQHFEDIGQDKNTYDVTYENSQARMRTLILMDTANKEGGLVVGTGDLSELALGWCTYNGDHMSMYAVNASVPKTLVKYLVSAVGEMQGGAIQTVLNDVLNTEISPELLPPDQSGKISQKTEDIVGPYELHDFYLYHAIRFGFEPKKVFYLAKNTFKDYKTSVLKKWLINFYRRFFNQQFKRSCIPDGVKIGSVTLSPRADWRMPSDAVSKLWLDEVENLIIE